MRQSWNKRQKIFANNAKYYAVDSGLRLLTMDEILPEQSFNGIKKTAF